MSAGGGKRRAAHAVFYPLPLQIFFLRPCKGGVLPPHIHNIYVIQIYSVIHILLHFWKHFTPIPYFFAKKLRINSDCVRFSQVRLGQSMTKVLAGADKVENLVEGAQKWSGLGGKVPQPLRLQGPGGLWGGSDPSTPLSLPLNHEQGGGWALRGNIFYFSSFQAILS